MKLMICCDWLLSGLSLLNDWKYYNKVVFSHYSTQVQPKVKLKFWMILTLKVGIYIVNSFLVIEAGGFKFWLLGLLVAVFLQLEWCISCRLPLKSDQNYQRYATNKHIKKIVFSCVVWYLVVFCTALVCLNI